MSGGWRGRMIGITLNEEDAIFLRELLHWYSASTFGPNSDISYELYAEINRKIKQAE
jgi:hypothetical protein